MAIRTILTYPDPLLHRAAEPVCRFDMSLSHLVADMVDTMRHANGLGLAASQIGELLNVVVLDVPREEGELADLFAVCNPVITRREGREKTEEACLSLPGFFVEVDRARSITVEGQNPDGSPFSVEAEGLLAICFQHELDHLEGKVLLDYVSSEDRERYRTRAQDRARAEVLGEQGRAL